MTASGDGDYSKMTTKTLSSICKISFIKEFVCYASSADVSGFVRHIENALANDIDIRIGFDPTMMVDCDEIWMSLLGDSSWFRESDLEWLCEVDFIGVPFRELPEHLRINITDVEARESIAVTEELLCYMRDLLNIHRL